MISDEIKARRKEKNLTQGEFADALGYKQSTVSGWETGARVPSLADIYKIADTLGCKAADLL